MSDASKQHSERVITALSRWQNSLQGQGFASKDVDLVRGYVRSLEEQLEALRQAEEAAQVQERVGNEGDADAIRRDAISRVLGIGLYAASSPASAPDELTDEEVEALGLDEIELPPPASNP